MYIYIFVLLILTQPKFWTADKVGHRCRTCISSVTSFSASSGPTSRQSCRCRRPAAERSSGLAVVSWWLPHCHPSPSSSLPKKLLYAFQTLSNRNALTSRVEVTWKTLMPAVKYQCRTFQICMKAHGLRCCSVRARQIIGTSCSLVRTFHF